MCQIADFNPGKDFNETFTVSLLSSKADEGFDSQSVGSQVTGKCDEHGIYWKNADKRQFRFRYFHWLCVPSVLVVL